MRLPNRVLDRVYREFPEPKKNRGKLTKAEAYLASMSLATYLRDELRRLGTEENISLIEIEKIYMNAVQEGAGNRELDEETMNEIKEIMKKRRKGL